MSLETDKWFVEELYNGKWCPAVYNRKPSPHRLGGPPRIFRSEPKKIEEEHERLNLTALTALYGDDNV